MKKLLIVIAACLIIVYVGKTFYKTYREVNTDPHEPTESTYELVIDRLTWEEAEQHAEAAGGHLATLNCNDDFQTVTALCNEQKITYCWLGAIADSNGQFSWITSEEFAVPQNWWAPGEPSLFDADGTAENYLCWWRINGGTLNDQRNNLPQIASEKASMAYIIEYDPT